MALAHMCESGYAKWTHDGSGATPRRPAREGRWATMAWEGESSFSGGLCVSRLIEYRFLNVAMTPPP